MAAGPILLRSPAGHLLLHLARSTGAHEIKPLPHVAPQLGERLDGAGILGPFGNDGEIEIAGELHRGANDCATLNIAAYINT
jgi:hypothetical protein